VEKKIMKCGEQHPNKTHHNTRFLPNNDKVINSKYTEMDKTCSIKEEKRDTNKFDDQNSRNKSLKSSIFLYVKIIIKSTLMTCGVKDIKFSKLSIVPFNLGVTDTYFYSWSNK
jgi:hypothetical protein